MEPKTTIFENVPDSRRRIMRSIKGKVTKPERTIRSILQAKGYRFRKNFKFLPDRPDIVFTAKKKVVFIHGCFWHSHDVCMPRKRKTSVRHEYWSPKFTKTVERNANNLKSLQEQGWSSLVIWECELANIDYVTSKISEFLGPPRSLKTP